MPSENQNAPKLLLIVTAPFGELFCAMYFVMGCGFQTVFALRPHHFSLNSAALPGKSYSYGNLSDLLEIIEAEAPDVVCLFSGYLFVADKIMSDEEFDRFMKQLERRGIKIITSDPFLGFSSRVPRFDPHNPFEQLMAMPVRFVGELMFGQIFPYLSRISSNLKRTSHLYVVDPDESGDVQRLSFFNPYIRRYVSELEHQSNGRPGQTDASSRDQPYWMFILANSDYMPEIERLGAAGFHELLAQKLRETLEGGRRPVLIAPTPCIEALSKNASLSDGLFIDNCDYNHYMALLVGAEYVFYWNIFSASVIARILNSGPIFFFAQGHLANAHQMMFEKGMKRYYNNASLTYLDQTHRLSQKELAGKAALQEAQLFKPFLENVCHLPTPNKVIQQLLQDSV